MAADLDVLCSGQGRRLQLARRRHDSDTCGGYDGIPSILREGLWAGRSGRRKRGSRSWRLWKP